MPYAWKLKLPEDQKQLKCHCCWKEDPDAALTGVSAACL